MKRSVTFFLISAVISFHFYALAQAAELTIHGSTTVYTNIFKTKQNEIEDKSGIKLQIIANGSGRGIMDLIKGKTDMAMISSSLNAAVARINKKYPNSIAKGTLTAHKVGETRISFIVHKSNPVQKLTLKQVRNILTGEIRNWSQVGGPNKPIMVISEDTNGGIRVLVERKVLGGKEISAHQHKEVPNGQQVSRVTNQISFAFGVSTPASVTGTAKILETDEVVSQPLILVTKGKATETMSKVIAATTEAYAK
ncbi:MAG: substrate-binding domain-containing protein [Methyloligellaceae bacterium]